jgi:hypothetical protein
LSLMAPHLKWLSTQALSEYKSKLSPRIHHLLKQQLISLGVQSMPVRFRSMLLSNHKASQFNQVRVV